jgi:hypothetical protein
MPDIDAFRPPGPKHYSELVERYWSQTIAMGAAGGAVDRHAREQAMAELLDDIHAMLRALLAREERQ